MQNVITVRGQNSRHDLERYLAPLCAGVGLWTMRHSQPVEPHAMRSFEINYVHSGEETTFFDDGSRMQARGGDVSVIQPGVWHHCEHDAMSPVTYLVFMVDPQPPRPCPLFSGIEVESILRLLRRSGNRVVHANGIPTAAAPARSIPEPALDLGLRHRHRRPARLLQQPAPGRQFPQVLRPHPHGVPARADQTDAS